MNLLGYMKMNYKVLLLGLLLATASCSFTTKKYDPDPNSDKDKVLIELISFVLQRGHYSPETIDDTFSEEVYKSYIQSLDPLKRYFLASDLEEFSAYKHSIDDEIREGKVDFFNLTYNRLQQRMEESKEFYKEILSKPFDFSKEEKIVTDYKNIPYAKNRKELKEHWRKQLKFSVISAYYEKKEDQKTLSEQTDTLSIKSDAQLEIAARKSVENSMEEYFNYADDLVRKDWFSVYLNSIVMEFDPHTTYFAPQDKDRFDIEMSGSLEGIGARLQKKDDNVTVIEIISGGPAWKDEELEVGDEIRAVKQEDEEKPVNIIGMRLDDAVDLIKGPKGTKVTLTVKKVDGTIEDITITRDVVVLQDTYAKSSMIEKNNHVYGIIDLPRFYFDMQDYDKRNAASDVKQEIMRLKEQGMDGLVIDLRGNGGGSLATVVDIAGMFIKNGPVVQVRSGEGEIEVLKDRNDQILWDGPLVILVNELSASASEILAAAMQDYKRAIIIGSEQTYGKGTVQNVVDLNAWMRNNSFGDMGALKLTTQKFYRINGGSTQLRGVHSDVVVPDRYSYIDIGEREMENPLPWDQIEPADYSVWNGYIDYDETIANSKKRMAQNKLLALIDENAKWIKQQQDMEKYPLRYEEYAAQVKQNEAEASKFEAISEYQTDLTYTSLPYEKELFAQDSTLAEKRKRWHENLSKDVYMEEAIHVLQDLNNDSIAETKVVNVKKKKVMDGE
ncbi:MAG TPA: carboxy terminal-processing peptidase [Flavobacteriaceae bacterium]|nr:carboxy terminal-processing peptidase [Flavobacteriaceae bacterium]